MGAILTATVSVWVPSAYTGGTVALTTAGGSTSANMALRDQWQTVTVRDPITASRVAGPWFSAAPGAGGSNTFYSSGWGWSRSTDPAPIATGLGYGVAGGWGNLALPFQAFVTVERGTAPGAGGSSNSANGQAGWGSPIGGYGVGAIGYGADKPGRRRGHGLGHLRCGRLGNAGRAHQLGANHRSRSGPSAGLYPRSDRVSVLLPLLTTHGPTAVKDHA